MNRTHSNMSVLIRSVIDGKTKPIGALGRIEALAAQIATIQQTLTPVAEDCILTIFAGDHGMAEAGVSAYPQIVTRQMVLNFLAGGAAANVFAKTVGAQVQVVDAGIAGDRIEHPALVSRTIGKGTQNAINEPSMTAAEFDQAFSCGQEIGRAGDHNIVCFGEMGIGNTSSASLVAAKILGRPVADLVGRGTGLDDKGVEKKCGLLDKAATRTADTLSPQMALMEYGGFEIVMMMGAMIGAATARKIVMVDGFIATCAALAASRINPRCFPSLVFCHKSAEAGHTVLLDALEAAPLLDLDMRLGEGTGALLAVPLVRAAVAMLTDMASFEDAGVDGPT